MTSTTPPTAPAVGLEVRGLRKVYGTRAAVDDLTFACTPGTVTGFLGPNGAGKSTTLRILTGLARADEGEALVGGRPFRSLVRPARTIGVMLDARALHSGRTGLETLRLTARTLGMPAARADEVLAMVGLEGAGGKRVGGYSYGMRQRLGIGVALIGDPSVLVLDEPANGLDPEGIRWMRSLLRSFADAGGTVLLSSHQLREVEATVDRLVVISRGRLVREGTLEELTAGSGTRVTALEPAALRKALDRHGIAYEPRAGEELEVSLAPEDMGRLALREQIVLTALGASGGGGLEDVFFTLTGQEEQPGAPGDGAPAPDAATAATAA
ncbi:ABC transporter ATP-binding protein [Brachybacterium saurashtrense]|uniref:ATP-binding cassette domain-containing protein n=1 Tax=Brachybacterium saurashtrense TaxID=556288 RepID=A0A345YPR9_9MICO|nr:ATP-binding cassette domain-containing protein [Brachybacterium saurashtrense]AXK45921.1 ATP-binding cassette domain-containing protein [Brachybacterium saurashtrense]RRR23659.1 ATP-binding cassette domain-containing protein [Brachybacterium saurashtrense]